MKNWHKYRNYRKCKNDDGTFSYFIVVDGQDVEVSADIYIEYSKISRKMEYLECDLKRDRILQDAGGKAVKDKNGLPITLPEREVSLDKLTNEDWDFPTSAPSPEDIVIQQFEIARLYYGIALLTHEEQALINALFFVGMTEQKYAESLAIKQQSVNERKRRILAKLKKLMNI